MARTPHILMVFVDGLGCGAASPDVNPLHADGTEELSRLLTHHARPIDARLGVPGLPQSATGQTALLTGSNAPALMGRHVEGFPGSQLQELIREHGFMAQLVRRGFFATFANAS